MFWLRYGFCSSLCKVSYPNEGVSEAPHDFINFPQTLLIFVFMGKWASLMVSCFVLFFIIEILFCSSV